LLSQFFDKTIVVTSARMGVNYGLNKVRFMAPVPVGSRLRAHLHLHSATPIEGNGLYGTIYGFIAIDRDGTTVRGIAFHEHSETPGLGSEIAAPKWRSQWPQRKLFDDDWELAMEVVKRGAGPPDKDPHRVDAITGATISSFAVEDILIFWLNENGFGPYLKRMRAEQAAQAAAPAPAVAAATSKGGS
jgi:hypothetical protein